ncbi:MAG: serine hydrolase domain-containing protein [Acidimicrobiales bacterium]
MDLEDPAKVGMSAERLDRIGPYFESRYVDTGKLPGVLTLVARRGQVVHLGVSGQRDVERGAPLTEDTVVRLYSMTKPVTSVALMSLYERGMFQLDDPVGHFIPELADLDVYQPDGSRAPSPVPVTIQQLLTHTSGFTYGFLMETEVDALYRQRGVGGLQHDGDLSSMIAALGELPLLFEPGTRWNYGVSTDICGRLVEVLSGQTLDAFFTDHIFGPLGMHDTAFFVAPAHADRFAACYTPSRSGGLYRIDDPETSAYVAPPTFLSGGGGLVGTAGDYLRFATMLLNRGELDGVRILSRKTVDYMTGNHLPTGGDLGSMGRPVFSETSYDGIGFGLGFSVMLDPARAHVMGSPGEYAWGGAASTMFWVDPAEELIGMLLTQLLPSSTYPVRRQMRVLTYQALTD